MVKSKPNIQAIWVRKTPITSARLKAWADLSTNLHRHLRKLAIVKLYQQKHAITSADLLNDRVIPFYEAHDIPLLRILQTGQ